MGDTMTFTERRQRKTRDTGIYQITNLANGKRYIGSAMTLSQRWRQHKCALSKGDRRANRRLLNAWNKDGPDNFEFKPILYCSAENLVMYEQAAIDSLKPEYNIRKDAASNLGIKLSAETRRRISEVQKGVPKGAPSEEHRRNISRALTGKRLSAATRRKISEVQRGKVVGLDARRNMSRFTDEQVAEIKKRIAAGEVQSHIARDMGVCDATVSNIKSGKRYQWVEAA